MSSWWNREVYLAFKILTIDHIHITKCLHPSNITMWTIFSSFFCLSSLSTNFRKTRGHAKIDCSRLGLLVCLLWVFLVHFLCQELFLLIYSFADFKKKNHIFLFFLRSLSLSEPYYFVLSQSLSKIRFLNLSTQLHSRSKGKTAKAST
jgi:hypothetical protein